MIQDHPIRRFLLILVFLSLLLALTSCVSQTPLSEPVAPQTPGTQHGPGEIARIEAAVIGLLAVAALVNLVTLRLQIPYTIGLVLIGFALSLFVRTNVFRISPEIILALLLPPLLFEAAYHVNLRDLKDEISSVLTLAILGVIFTMALVGVLIWLGAGIALPYALVFGALIAPTDPVAVVSLFRKLGVPGRLLIILEGESLFNDGTAIVIFKLMLTFAITGQFNLGSGVLQFFVVAGGGLLVGVTAGLLVSTLIRRIDNRLVETVLTTVLAYGSYLIAEYYVGVSGVLAVVASGLAVQWFKEQSMSPGTQIIVFDFWEYAAFLANSLVFLLIGLETDLSLLLENAIAIIWSILAVLVARVIIVFVLLPLFKRKLPPQWRAVLSWGGSRGAVSLALVLSLTIGFKLRDQLLAMTFGVVLFTLIVQGLTITPLIRRSGIQQIDEVHQAYQRRHARAAALQAANNRLQALLRNGSISEYVYKTMKPVLENQLNEVMEEQREVMEKDPSLREEALKDTWKDVLRTQRSVLNNLYQRKAISEAVYAELTKELDEDLENPKVGQPS